MTRSYSPSRAVLLFNGVDLGGCGGLYLTKHAHEWKPIEGERARYACACGEQARRDERTGELVATPRDKRVRLDPRVQAVQPHGKLGADGCAWVGREDPEEL